LALVSTVGYCHIFSRFVTFIFLSKKEIISPHMTKYKNLKNLKIRKNFDFDPFDCCGARKDVRVNGAGICGADCGVCFDVSQIRRQWERMT
jgi:hypothetical protein